MARMHQQRYRAESDRSAAPWSDDSTEPCCGKAPSAKTSRKDPEGTSRPAILCPITSGQLPYHDTDAPYFAPSHRTLGDFVGKRREDECGRKDGKCQDRMTVAAEAPIVEDPDLARVMIFRTRSQDWPTMAKKSVTMTVQRDEAASLSHRLPSGQYHCDQDHRWLTFTTTRPHATWRRDPRAPKPRTEGQGKSRN